MADAAVRPWEALRITAGDVGRAADGRWWVRVRGRAWGHRDRPVPVPPDSPAEAAWAEWLPIAAQRWSGTLLFGWGQHGVHDRWTRRILPAASVPERWHIADLWRTAAVQLALREGRSWAMAVLGMARPQQVDRLLACDGASAWAVAAESAPDRLTAARGGANVAATR